MAKSQNKFGKKGNKSQPNSKPKFTVIKSRKEKRKQERLLKKQTKHHFYEKKYHREKIKETDFKEAEINDNTVAKRQKPLTDETIETKKRKKKEAEEKVKNARRKKELQRANVEEEKNIKRLEKQLKLNKRKGKDKEIRLPSSFSAEGLDYILDVCDPSKIENLDMSESEDDKSNDEQDDYCDEHDVLQNDALPSQSEGEDDNITDDDLEDEVTSNMNEDIEMSPLMNEYENANRNSNESDCDDMIESSDKDELPDEQSLSMNENDKEIKYWEDIYGRTRDSDGNVVTVPNGTNKEKIISSDISTSNKYVPPAMRAKMGTENEKLIKLKKQIKGLLNRLAESNMHSICRQLEDLYSCNSRNDMNECLSVIISSSILATSGTLTTPER